MASKSLKDLSVKLEHKFNDRDHYIDSDINPAFFTHRKWEGHLIYRVTGNVNLSYAGLDDIPAQFKTVDRTFDVSYNRLTTLNKGPQEAVSYYCNNNSLTTLEGFPNKAKTLIASNNHITSLVGVEKILHECTSLHLSNNPIVEGGIGLIFIKNLNDIRCNEKFLAESTSGGIVFNSIKALSIIRKYLRQGKDGLLACANELEEAGLERFAIL